MNWRTKETEYEELPQERDVSVQRQIRRKSKSFYAVFLFVLLLSNGTTGAAMFWAGSIWHEERVQQRFDTKIETPITYSPANQVIRYLDAKPYKAEIFQRNRWRGPPEVNNDDIDRAWAEISEDAGLIRLDDQDLLLMNLTDDNPLRPFHRLAKESGGGFAGMIEVFHLLHCLRNLRETQFYNWDYYKQIERWRMSERMIADHNDHCLDVIRMNLMCHADVTPAILFDPVKLPSRRYPFVDFSTRHYCRNFDEILEWSKTNPKSLKRSQIGLASTYKGPAEGEEPWA